MEPFNLPIEVLRARRGVKWRRHGEDVLPAFVADMDFAVPDPVQRAIQRIVEEQDYGYPERMGDAGLEAAFAHRMRERFGWAIEPSRVLPVADLIQGIAATIEAFSQPGDGLVVQTPVYPPFLHLTDETNRRRVLNPLVDDGRRLSVDVAGLERAVDSGTRMILLCSPHNPSGRVLSRGEIEALGRVAIERDLIIVSDEIHSDLVYPGARHLPTGSLNDEIAARTVTVNSATKSFNIAGLRCGLMYFGSDQLLERFRSAIPTRLLGAVSVIGVDATVAAWREGQPWLDQVMLRLEANRDRVAAWVDEVAPAIRHYRPEATYLAWLECAGLEFPGAADGASVSPQEFFLREARVGLSAGGDFGPGGESCVRLNFATSAPILEEILDRMAGALERAGLLSEPRGRLIRKG